MTDPILKNFLRHSIVQATALAAASDLLRFVPEPGQDPQRFLVEFRCKGLVKNHAGQIEEVDNFLVGIAIADDYLRRPVDPVRMLTWLGPRNAFHPNIAAPFICIGKLAHAPDLVWVIHQLHEIITYQKWAAHDALNGEAAQWARNNQHHLPVDTRPLRRRRLALNVEHLAGGPS